MPDKVETSPIHGWARYFLPLVSNEIRNTWLKTVDSDDFNDIQYNKNPPHRNTLAIGEKCQFFKKKMPLIVLQAGSLKQRWVREGRGGGGGGCQRNRSKDCWLIEKGTVHSTLSQKYHTIPTKPSPLSGFKHYR